MYKPCRSLECPFDLRKACRRLVEVQRVRFDHRKANVSLVEARRVRFDIRKACKRLVEVRESVLTTAMHISGSGSPFDLHKACRGLVEVQRERPVSQESDPVS